MGPSTTIFHGELTQSWDYNPTMKKGDKVHLSHPAWSREYDAVVVSVSEYAINVILDDGWPAKVHPTVVTPVSPDGLQKMPECT